jgi:hypothetical protein
LGGCDCGAETFELFDQTRLRVADDQVVASFRQLAGKWWADVQARVRNERDTPAFGGVHVIHLSISGSLVSLLRGWGGHDLDGDAVENGVSNGGSTVRNCWNDKVIS